MTDLKYIDGLYEPHILILVFENLLYNYIFSIASKTLKIFTEYFSSRKIVVEIFQIPTYVV